MTTLGAVPENIDFPAQEEKVQKHWVENNTFKKSLE